MKCAFYSCKNETKTKHCSEECRVFNTYKSVSRLKKYIWGIYSEYIRKRDADFRGYVTCITCGKVALWDSGHIHAGHFLHGDNPGTWINDFNVHGQCDSCNTYSGGKRDIYGIRIAQKYGVEKLYELERLHNHPPTTWSILPLRDAYKEVIQKYESLEN